MILDIYDAENDDEYIVAWTDMWEGERHGFGCNKKPVKLEMELNYNVGILKLSMWPHRKDKE